MKAVLFALLVAISVAIPDPEYLEFTEWMVQNGKKYESELEHAHRFNAFKDSIRKVAELNARQDGATYGLGPFADLTHDEFEQKYTTRLIPPPINTLFKNLREVPVKPVLTAGPLGIDWQLSGKVTPVRDQMSCGSCWAFSTIAGIESYVLLHSSVTPSTLDLSEQQVVDCTTMYAPYGCDGGLMNYAFDDIINNGGVCAERDYPYTATDGVACKAKSCTKVPGTVPAGYSLCSTLTTLKSCLSSSPVTVALYASDSSFQYYKSGIVNATSCYKTTSLNHAVFLVGDGAEGTTNFWKIKNSWGSSWGDLGYIRFASGVNCYGMENSKWNWVVK